MRRLALLALAVLSVLGTETAQAEDRTVEVGVLSVSVRSAPVFSWPLDYPKLRLSATNTSGEAVRVAFRAAVQETGQEATPHPQPNVLYVEPGETQALSVIVDAEIGRLNELPFGVPSRRTIAWTFEGQGTLETPIDVVRVDVIPQPGRPLPAAANPMAVSGRVVDERGRPLPDAQVEARAGGTGFPTGTDRAGRFSLTLPGARSWVLSAAKRGYRTAYAFLDEARPYPGLKVVLRRRTGPEFLLGQAEALERGDVGVWQGTLTPDERLVLLPQGMEVWRAEQEPYRRQAKLSLFTTEGRKVWERAMGYEAWGADLSRDGRWAVYVTKDPLEPRIVLLDAANGNAVWERRLDTASFPSASGYTGHSSNVVRFSPDAAAIGLGTGEGDFYLLDRATGTVWWSAFLKGQVRGVAFSPDGAFVYAGAGNGVLAKLAVTGGARAWAAPIGSWPLLDGLRLSPDGTKVGTMGKAGEATVVATATGRVLFSYDTGGIGQWADFSGDSKVFAAASFAGTFGFDAATGKRVFRLDASKAGRFARGTSYLFAVAGGGAAVYDRFGTRVSNPVLVDPQIRNFQFAWMAPDGTRFLLAPATVDRPGSPILLSVRGQQTR